MACRSVRSAAGLLRTFSTGPLTVRLELVDGRQAFGCAPPAFGCAPPGLRRRVARLRDATIRTVDRYLALLRGINVGGRNKVPMADLRRAMEDLGFVGARTFIASGNVLFGAPGGADSLASTLEAMLCRNFELDGDEVMVCVLDRDQLTSVVHDAPHGFGGEPGVYKYDVAFLKGVTGNEVLTQLRVNPDVDTVWARSDAVYHRRLISRLSRSRMSRVVGTPVYRHMTIRNWNTTTRLLALMEEAAQDPLRPPGGRGAVRNPRPPAG